MKYLFIFIFLIIAGSASAQQISYVQFQEEAKTQINLQPEYGDVKKDKDQQEEDRKFIELVLTQDTTLKKGSAHLVTLGFKYLAQGDMETAMKRFNQAWLLDPKNENAYWGFGAVYGTFSDYDAAIAQYDKGLAINPESAVILTDKATLYFVQFEHDNIADKLDKAITLLKKSYAIDGKNVNTIYKLSICYFWVRIV
jgi:tetratricopeptide (TPR) repeat protein